MSFNYFGGKNIKFCLPSLLSEYNFQTISITGTKSHFHNAKNAYPTLGFEKNISKDDLINDDFDGIHPSGIADKRHVISTAQLRAAIYDVRYGPAPRFK